MTPTAATSLRFPPGFLASLHRSLSYAGPPAQAATLLRQAGCEAADGFLNAFEDFLTQQQRETSLHELPQEHFWEQLSAFFSAQGWGALRWEPVHPGIAALDSTNWVEAEEPEGQVHPLCHLTTGLLAGMLSHVAGEDVAVLETECRAQGDRRCRFLFGSPVALTILYERMCEGASAGEAIAHLR